MNTRLLSLVSSLIVSVGYYFYSKLVSVSMCNYSSDFLFNEYKIQADGNIHAAIQNHCLVQYSVSNNILISLIIFVISFLAIFGLINLIQSILKDLRSNNL